MSFLWSHNLWLMAALPLFPLLYVAMLRRRGKRDLRFSRVDLAREAVGRRWRQHVPPALLWVACALLLLAIARPSAPLTLPWKKSTIMLAMDVSLSMRVADVLPSRIQAAQDAAKAFLGEVPRDVDVGLVTFAGSALVAQRATRDRAAVANAIDGIQMQIGTAVGNAIVVCLAELFPDQGYDLGEMTYGKRDRTRAPDAPKTAPPQPMQPAAPGSYDSAAVVLLSDGRRTTGVETLEAAKLAADRGLRVYVIGLGTVDGAVAAGEGMAIYMQLDEPTLREVARMTGGEYHHAGTAEDLREVYHHLGTQVQVRTRETELTAPLAMLAALFVAIAAGLSLAWFNRLA